jgi:hypothetical protein
VKLNGNIDFTKGHNQTKKSSIKIKITTTKFSHSQIFLYNHNNIHLKKNSSIKKLVFKFIRNLKRVA